MGYVNTPAHMTASLAVHGGDRIWPGNQKLVVRRANIYSTSPANLPTGLPGTNLGEEMGWMEAIGPAISALTGATLIEGYGLRVVPYLPGMAPISKEAKAYCNRTGGVARRTKAKKQPT